MKTQIVYVVTSTPEDFFLEELWASLYSLRYFHPEARVVVLTDFPTAKRLNLPAFQQLLSMITELITVNVTEEYNGMQRSREIKTNVRNLIEGKYLYLDTDTIITSPLDTIDILEINNIAMVPDFHRYSYTENADKNLRVALPIIVKKLYSEDISDIPIYFNAGVQLVSDNSFTREFFKKWHENWQIAVGKGVNTDQQTYAYTDKCYGYITELLPDTFNCQVMCGANYLVDAKILHIYRIAPFFMNGFSQPLWDLYHIIKKEGTLSNETKAVLNNAKYHFSNLSCIVGHDEMDFLRGKFYKLYKFNCFHLRWFIDCFNHWALRWEYWKRYKK